MNVGSQEAFGCKLVISSVETIHQQNPSHLVAATHALTPSQAIVPQRFQDVEYIIALWGHTLDQHHTGLRQVEVG